MPALFKFKVQSLKFKIALFLLFFSLYAIRYTLYADSAFAQNTSQKIPNPTPIVQYSPLPSYIPQQSPLFANLQLINLAQGLTCILGGQSFSGQPCINYIPSTNILGQTSNVPILSSVKTSGGLLGAGNSILIGMFTNPPLSTRDYLENVTDGFGLIPPSHAQSVPGSGNSVLNPILPLWQVSRNFAYLLMILIFITVGLMIMFRSKINPQTVITVQAALPGLVIGLILITFSYFAAALISDMAFIGTDLVGYYFSSAINDPSKGSLLQEIKDKNLVSIGSSFAGKLSNSQLAAAANELIKNLDKQNPPFNADTMVRASVALISYQLGSSVGQAGGALLDTFAAAIPATKPIKLTSELAKATSRWTTKDGLKETAAELNAVSGPLFGTVFAFLGYQFPDFMIGLLLYLVALFAVIYAVFRLFLALINNYLAIIFLTISAPFHFLAASLPGRQGIALNWARNMLCNVLAFPAVIAVFYFAAFLLGRDQIKTFNIATAQSLTTTSTFPLFGGMDLSFIRVLLAFGAVMVTPKIPDLICKAVGKPGGAGQLIEQAITQTGNAGQKYGSEIQSNLGKARSNIKENWTRWKGQDPHGALADKAEYFRRERGFVLNDTSLQRGLPAFLRRTKLYTDWQKAGPSQEAQQEANEQDKPVGTENFETARARRTFTAARDHSRIATLGRQTHLNPTDRPAIGVGREEGIEKLPQSRTRTRTAHPRRT